MRRGTDRAVRKGSRRRRLGVISSRGDEGVTLIELLVAIVVILIILIPTAVFIIQAQKAVSAEHLRAEAINVATRQLETLQLEAAQGNLPTGTSTVTYAVGEALSRNTKFKVTTSWTVITQGTNQSICAAGAAVAQQIWLVTAVVTWPGMAGASPVVQTTEIAPAQAGAIQQFAGEVAVSLIGPSSAPFLADAVTAKMTGQWTGSGTGPTPPSGTFTTEIATTTAGTSTSSDGCIVFENLDAYSDADGSYDYTLSFANFANNAGLVAGDEKADSNPGGAFTMNIGSLEPGVPQPETVTIDTGTQLPVGYYTGSGGSCTTASALTPPLPSNGVPVSVNNSFLTAYPPNDTWVAFGSAPISSLLLFPWSGTTAVWAGDEQYSHDGLSMPYGPCSVTGSLPVYLRVYPLDLTVTGSASSLTATDALGGGYAMALNFVSGISNTSVPLGEYLLSHDNDAPVTVNGNPAYVWVTAAGECSDPVVEATPPTSGCHAASLGVTAS
jgi:type II secretory pathway pseudopilin PulG